MKMRHDSWHPASISSTPASCGAAKIRAQKTLLVSTPANQCSTSCCTRLRRSGKWRRERGRGWGGRGGCQLKRPNPCGELKCALKSEKNQKGTVGLLTSWNLVSRPRSPRWARRWRVLQAEKDEGFWTLLNFLGCLKRTCNLMQRQREWAMGQLVQCWG